MCNLHCEFLFGAVCEHYRDFKVALAVYYSVKTSSVKFYIDKNPKDLPFCEITQSKSHGNYWQNISENNKIYFCDPHKSRCINARMDMNGVH